MQSIKILFAAMMSAALLGVTSQAHSGQDTHKAAMAQYQQSVQQGKSYRDAYVALAYEIAYENAAVQAKSPCRTMTRGL